MTKAAAHFSIDEIKILKETIRREIVSKPPTIGIIGVSGVGKSSTLNALFKTNLEVGHSVATTKEFLQTEIELKFQSDAIKNVNSNLVVIDAPGLGEDISLDQEYIRQYRQHLPKADVILWVLAARNRGISLDQQFLKEFKEFHHKMVFGINQVDLVEPMNWNKRINLPSKEQLKNIETILADRRKKMEDIVGAKVKMVVYSAATRYCLQDLFSTLLDSCPADRSWIFQGLKTFKYDDWVPKEIRELVASEPTENFLKRWRRSAISPLSPQM